MSHQLKTSIVKIVNENWDNFSFEIEFNLNFDGIDTEKTSYRRSSFQYSDV